MKPQPPDENGWHGSAWTFRDTILKHHPKSAVIAAWVINAPWAHPFWSNYLLTIIHLRPVPEIGPPMIYIQGATHEIVVYAIDPKWTVKRDEIPPLLHPANFASQFIARDDAEAAERASKSVREILDGQLSPDTDFTQSWIARWGDCMIRGPKEKAGETIIHLTAADGTKITMKQPPKPPGAQPDIPNRN